MRGLTLGGAVDAAVLLERHAQFSVDADFPGQANMKTMIVPRGLDPSYYFFTEITAKANEMAFVIDRRDGERRRAAQSADLERRARDRRAEPPAGWPQEGFIAIGSSDPV
jgi:hypothetical protein